MKFLYKKFIKYTKGCDFLQKLPNIYKNTIDKRINNNMEKCMVNDNNNYEINDSNMNKIEINSYIEDLFSSNTYIFNIPVIIKTNDMTYDTYLATKTNNYLLTIENEKIIIDDIISIKRK